MLISIDPDGPIPIYQQIRDRVVEAIACGEAPATSALPSTRQLATDLGVNFHTVNKSYDLLRQEGLVRVGRRSGVVVHRDASSGPAAPGYLQEWTARLRTLLAEAAAQGLGRDEILSTCRDVVDAFALPTASHVESEPEP